MTLSELKIGDRVTVVNFHRGRRIYRITTVARRTATLIVTDHKDGTKWSVESGRQYGNRYTQEKINPTTEDDECELAQQNFKARVIDFLRPRLDGNWQSLGVESLEKIAVALGFDNTNGGTVKAEERL